MKKNSYQGPMPSLFFPADRVWIGEQLEQLPPTLKLDTCDRYAKAYWEVLVANDRKIEKDTMARNEANTRLRLRVEFCKNGGLSKTHQLEGVYKAASKS